MVAFFTWPIGSGGCGGMAAAGPETTLSRYSIRSAQSVVRWRAERQKMDTGASGSARSLTSASTIAAVERLARGDRRHARSPDAFDVDPWLLNTKGGVVDLRDGQIRPNRPDDLFTKCTSVAPGGRCKQWLKFLMEITRGNRKQIRYLQRLIGYTLTGIVREHVFAFLHGPGGNGKSVLLSIIAEMLGDYAITAMEDVFVLGRTEQHPTHQAALRGARMVVVTETEEGRPWAESRIKALTGGDRSSARIMRGDPFEFSPVFKLWISGNHAPALRNPDAAMRRRLHLVPLTFVPDKPNKELLETLRSELGGILLWAIRGCLAWQRFGLAPPDIILQATEEYFAEQDAISNWIAQRCKPGTNEQVAVRRAYIDWKAWAIARGEDPRSEKWFSAELERHFPKKKTEAGKVFVGLTLWPSDPSVW
jgi:putative DNA primase/helicase